MVDQTPASGEYRTDEPSPVIAPEGRPIVIGFVLVGAVVSAAAIWGLYRIGLERVGYVIAGVVGLVCLWCLWFFRDPTRKIPAAPGVVVSPADGVVTLLGRARPPSEAGLADLGEMDRVCVFMNVFNVHVNRAPVAGIVEDVHYFKGKFFNASMDKASLDNERMSLVLRTEEGTRLVAVQIAGLVARRIVCRVKAGALLSVGQRFGMIRFGSRVDVYLPEGYVPTVKLGEKTVAGETIIARRI
jgi:phosphatidylserine decarboxylase